MKRCWYMSEDDPNLIAAPAIAVMVFSVFSEIGHIASSANPLRRIALDLVIAAIPFTYFILASLASARRYSLSEAGLIIAYPFGIKKVYFWKDFSEIALCKVHYASASAAHKLAIRCVVGKEKKGPKHAIVGKERWSTMEYELVHFGKVITIYYSEERYNEFQTVCPIRIADYQYLEDRP